MSDTLPVRRARAPLPRLLALAIAAILIGGLIWRVWSAVQPAPLPGVPATEAALQEKWGVRVSHIAVLADGGLVDFRFQIIDPDKAAPLFDLTTRPILYVEKNGGMVDSLYHPPHGHNIVPGQSQYFIYNNTKGAIHSGDAVSVVIGDMRLEHVIAK